MGHRIVVAGAGLAGALLAARLGRDGHDVLLCERRGDPRAAGHVGGRSINLAISVRGLDALRQVGLDAAVLDRAVRMPGRMIHDRAGATVFQPYSADPDRAINSVSRSGLNLALIEAAAAEPSVRIEFDRRLVDVDCEAPAAIFIDERSGERLRVGADLVVACDGAYSAARQALQRTEGFDFSQHYLGHGYKELSIPPRPDGTWAMRPNALHIWPRGGFMMIALPNPDRSFTCTLFLAKEGRSDDEPGFDRIRLESDGPEGPRAFMERWFPDAVPMMPTMVEDFRRNPVGAMVTVRCRPWHRGRVVLLGDAAHAIVPFYGQGANCAFEDCVALAAALRTPASATGDRTPPAAAGLDAAIATYERARIENANAIADMALANFIEMRDHTASRFFRIRKKLEQGLGRLLPGVFVPLYDMVSFTTIPYAEARERARRQWRAVRAVGAGLVIVAIGAVAWAVTR
ncbi:MAG TPA: NAD(P)/FAD-dependent oxidoreductase [Phycisphaerales bacterium]|nr:NAD(P)/FAD-dependent oxidoreductase [Phycisphaerales bacterium]HMP37231.1 NAD(P)/FAD-dependent oxidoreductase [Phycisphaerales bacterium]